MHKLRVPTSHLTVFGDAALEAGHATINSYLVAVLAEDHGLETPWWATPSRDTSGRRVHRSSQYAIQRAKELAAAGERSEQTLRIPTPHLKVYAQASQNLGFSHVNSYLVAVLARLHDLEAPPWATPKDDNARDEQPTLDLDLAARGA